jgi:hypothetical protein
MHGEQHVRNDDLICPFDRPSRGQRLLRVLLVLIGLTLSASLFVHGGWLLLIGLVGLLVAIQLAVVGVGVLLSPATAMSRGSRARGLLVVLTLVAAQTRIACETGWGFGDLLDGQPVAMNCLAGLGVALQQYVEAHGDYPPSLETLVTSGLVHPKNLISPLDRGLPTAYSYAEWPPAYVYSSYVYTPGRGKWVPDASLLLAYEHSAWHLIDLRLFPDYARFALFGNGEVKLLDAWAFTAALERDAARRRELGWPRVSVRDIPTSAPASTAARSD